MKKDSKEQIIYEEWEDGTIKESNLEKYLLVGGVWALYGINKMTSENRCLNVGKSVNIGSELLYDISCLHFLKARVDGSKKYINQFNEFCGFNYESNQVQEYLYPHIALEWHSLKFIYIHNVSDARIESSYAKENIAKYWRNGSPFGVNKTLNLTSKRMQVIGNMFLDGGEVYSKDELLRVIENELGYDRKQATRLISDCIKEGFLIQMDAELYTR